MWLRGTWALTKVSHLDSHGANFRPEETIPCSPPMGIVQPSSQPGRPQEPNDCVVPARPRPFIHQHSTPIHPIAEPQLFNNPVVQGPLSSNFHL
ncbi:hypothetical protein BJX76DRAFT_340951 [Aspergillus varians]